MEPSHRRSDNYADPVGRNHGLMCVTAYGCTVQLTNATNTRSSHRGLNEVTHTRSVLGVKCEAVQHQVVLTSQSRFFIMGMYMNTVSFHIFLLTSTTKDQWVMTHRSQKLMVFVNM